MLAPPKVQSVIESISQSVCTNCGFSASDDIPHADEVRTLIKDIWDLRIAKLRKSIDIMVSQQEVYARVSFFL